MIALVASVVLVAYVLVPGLLFRVIFGFFIPLAKFQKTRTEEVMAGVVASAAPLIASILLVSSCPWFSAYPVHVGVESRSLHYEHVISGLYSVTSFDQQAHSFWTSLGAVVRHQANLLTWFYLVLVVETMMIGFLGMKYGSFRRFRPYEWIATRLLLPNISKWHVLLTPFLFPDGDKRAVKVDILVEGDRLYRGEVADYSATREGELLWIFLTRAERFRRQIYLQDQQSGKDPKSRDYWKAIPGDNLLIGGDKIVNLNLRYELEEPLRRIIERLVNKMGLRLVSVEPVDDQPSTQSPQNE